MKGTMKTLIDNKTEPKHTPGSWNYTEHEGVFGIFSKESKEIPIATVDYEGDYFERPNEAGTKHGGELEANARLIAAAPELLEALKAIREAYKEMFDVMPVAWQTFDNIAKAAIAKAEGRQ